MSRPLTAIAPVIINGRKVDWMIATQNHENNSRTWVRQGESFDGPEGQYWSLNEDSFDKSVWVVEGDTPIVPRNVISEAEQENPRGTKATLNAAMVTRDGQRIEGWDLYDDFIILGETATDYIFALEFDKFKWEEWGYSLDDDLPKQVGKGNNLENTFLGGTGVLYYRLSNINQSVGAGEWSSTKTAYLPAESGVGIGATKAEATFDIASNPMFTAREEYIDRLSKAQGKKYFTLPKWYLKDAITVPVAQPQLGYTDAQEATKILELTWEGTLNARTYGKPRSKPQPEVQPTPGSGCKVWYAKRRMVSTSTAHSTLQKIRGEDSDLFAALGGRYVRYYCGNRDLSKCSYAPPNWKPNSLAKCKEVVTVSWGKYADLADRLPSGGSVHSASRDYIGMRMMIMDRVEKSVYQCDHVNKQTSVSQLLSRQANFDRPLNEETLPNFSAKYKNDVQQYAGSQYIGFNTDLFRDYPMDPEYRFQILEVDIFYWNRIAMRQTSCPDPAMRILMADGSSKPAGELAAGDMLRTKHEDGLEMGNYEVEYAALIKDSEKIKLTFDTSEMVCSLTHKLFVGGSWREAKDLVAGDEVSGQKLIRAEAAGNGDVVHITVKDAHTYICEGLLSHNKSVAPKPPPYNYGGSGSQRY
tara:strand:- start:6094 stop:8016 length:1923 start_codon:yes stop_codon:yes gene_type:complete